MRENTPMCLHTGELNDATQTRVAVIFRQLAEDPMHTLVIKYDTIVRDGDRDEFLKLLHSPEANRTRDFAKFLGDRGMLNYYHKAGYLKPLHIDEVVMTPGNGQRFQLRDVINSINKENGMAPLPTVDQLANLSEASPLSGSQRQELMNHQGHRATAKSILIQAQMLQNEVNKKLESAYAMDPSLRPLALQIPHGLPLDKIMEIPNEDGTTIKLPAVKKEAVKKDSKTKLAEAKVNVRVAKAQTKAAKVAKIVKPVNKNKPV